MSMDFVWGMVTTAVFILILLVISIIVDYWRKPVMAAIIKVFKGVARMVLYPLVKFIDGKDIADMMLKPGKRG